MSWLLLIGVLPAIVFFNNAWQYERKVGMKYQQLYIARNLQMRNNVIDKYYNDHNINDTKDNLYKGLRKKKGIYTDFYHHTFVEEAPEKQIHINNLESSRNLETKKEPEVIITQSNIKDSLLTLLLIEKPLFNPQAVEKRKLAFNSAMDTSWLWEQHADSLLCFDFVLNDLQKKDSVVSKGMHLKTQLPKLKNNGYGNFPIAFWFLLSVALISVFELLKLILKRIFPFQTYKEVRNLTFLELIEKSKQSNIFGSKVFAVKLSGESDGMMKTNIRQNGFKCVDISTDPDFKNWMIKGGQIVLLNLDESINNLDLFKKKNDLLGKITKLNKIQVIISSRRSPKQIIEYYTGIKEQEGIDKNFVDQEVSRFSHLISQFQVFYCSLQNVTHNSQAKSDISTFLNRELSMDVYLFDLKKTLINKYQKNKNNYNDEDVILKIQDMASEYYSKLWNSCTLEEKMILYDLSRNSLINIKNSEVIRILKILMEKSLVITNDYFMIMNRSFKNYILTNADPLDLKEMDRLAKQNDAWQSFRIPLIIFASGIIIFLVATQQHFLSNLSTMLASFIAIAGVFVKVSGIFSLKTIGQKKE